MAAPSRALSTRPAATVAVVSTAAFLASLDLFIVNIAFPDIRTAFGHADLAAMSWILNGYTVVFAAFLNPAGRLGDRYGHRRMFLWGLVVFTLASAACGLSPSFTMLVSARVVQAVGAAMLMPSSLALLMAAVPASRRAVAVSTWSAVGAMAAALGPPVGGLLVEVSWRWIFFVNVPLGVAAFLAGTWVLAWTPATGVGVPDLVGAVMLVLGIGALVWALVELPTAGWTSTEVVTAALVATGFMAGAVWRSVRHPLPALDLAVVRVVPMWSSCLALLVFSAAFAAMLLGGVMFLTGVWHLPPSVAGLCLSPGPFVVVVVSLTVAGKLVGRLGIGAVAATGATLYVAGVVFWLCRAHLEPNYFADFLPGQILTGAGVGLVMPSLSAVSGLALQSHQWGAGSALTNTARQLGTVLGTAILTMIYHAGVDLDTVRRGWVFVVSAASAAVLIAIGMAVWWRTDATRAPGPDGARCSTPVAR
ncbi:MFS transporter [Mycobacterium yunnanensis]|uniref:MFS transporter n=1 Tax=Mycobacterium yunnanensis TaxID=368477 RepID=A0A9X2Z3X5_9MYCO|nr:MFS transporter [Mycobacterium yunnanensis]MCV7422139.1 MFS transporter [Mycobacterium yunnanensis]